ncbi:MAG: hypothetical protein ACKVHH_07405 [Candidatus Poseidoniales archaeon]
MPETFALCRKYLDFHYLQDHIFHNFEESISTIQYTVASSYSRPRHSEEGVEWQLDHAFIENSTSGKWRLIIIIHEAWFIRCEDSENNHGQENAKLNKEFNQFVLKILSEIRPKLALNKIQIQIPSLNFPPQPPSDSEPMLLIRKTIDKLSEQGGPNNADISWISPSHGYSFG